MAAVTGPPNAAALRIRWNEFSLLTKRTAGQSVLAVPSWLIQDHENTYPLSYRCFDLLPFPRCRYGANSERAECRATEGRARTGRFRQAIRGDGGVEQDRRLQRLRSDWLLQPRQRVRAARGNGCCD